MDRESYQRAYADSLEHIEEIFNRLCIRHKLSEKCKQCPFLEEIENMRTLVKSQKFDQIEKELGYFLP